MTKVWISALIPKQGAEVYEGIRLAIATSEKECYQDLGEWLTELSGFFDDDDDEDDEDQEDHQEKKHFDPATAPITDIVDELERAVEEDHIRLWKVETREWEEKDNGGD